MKLVIFDLDGTLTKTVAVDADSYVRAFADVFGMAGIDTDWSRYRDYTDGGIAREIFESRRGRKPTPAEMERIIAADEDYYTGQYYAARRHTIQLDFDHYVRALKKELAKGARRAAAAGNALPVQSRQMEAA